MITKEEAKKRMPIIQAFVEGKPLQGMYICGGYNARYEDWDANNPLDFENYVYKIKTEPKLRPYTFEEMCEAVKKHGGYVISKNRTVLNHINVADIRGIFENYHTDSVYEYDKLLESFVWLDDYSPCGVMEE